MSTATPAPSSSTPPQEEALCLDVNILAALLTRNRSQHRRAQYYRRLSMVLLSLRRYHILNLGDLIRSVGRKRERIASTLALERGRKRRWREDRWELSPADDDIPTAETPADGSTCDLDPSSITTLPLQLQHLHTVLREHLTEIMSRVLHCASSLYVEMSRGYFLPLCTVALGCISRIRVLLMRLGREGVVEVKKTVGVLREMIDLGKESKVWNGMDVKEVRGVLGLGELDMEQFLELDTQTFQAEERTRAKLLRRRSSGISSASSMSAPPGVEDEMQGNALNSNREKVGEGGGKWKNGGEADVAPVEEIGGSDAVNEETAGKSDGETKCGTDEANDIGEGIDVFVADQTDGHGMDGTEVGAPIAADNPNGTRCSRQTPFEEDTDANMQLVLRLRQERQQAGEGSAAEDKTKEKKKRRSCVNDSIEEACGKSGNEKKSRATAKKKKKRKSKKRDVFDDIFDGL